ncbi:MAG: sigma-54-dependent Fis family transcriptional regulator [Chlamydiae bacterium]|nr:sigma-54-dependent Fis family transcriptional regulator [Chlamydiota bacterium]MBI3276163.1 sigma-54-dependent Fis family transcriptional regulator [Chlamydiota bacterium]
MMTVTKDDPLPKLLSIEDDEGVRESIELALKNLYSIHFVPSAEEALKYLQEGGQADVATLDICLPGMSGIEALPQIKRIRPELPTIVISAVSDASTGVKSIKLGAYDYIVKPFMIDEIRQIIHHALESNLLKKKNLSLIREVSEKFHPDYLIGISASMTEIREKISQVAYGMTSVLITGETGTGKELVAKAVHYMNPHRLGPFTAVNCAALPQDLVESELFGHEKGSFTGASHRRIGAFEQAEGGTLFLDEVGELVPHVQAKLLRVLEEKKIQRLGGCSPIRLDVRLISATNKDLKQAIEKGEFRRDLYYRLCTFPIHLPPLRERQEDVFPLIEHWARILQKEMNLEILPQFSSELVEALQAFTWHGNVRELRNVLEAMFLTHRSRKPLVFTINHLPKVYLNKISSPKESEIFKESPDEESLMGKLEDFEKKLITEALTQCQGKSIETAKLLKISPRMLKYRMKKLGL